ncbi:flagellar biosynthetic protein FliO [Gracilinema caldarium]|uniref:FliO/MopB family protein n=1 Tax=Gracilinema caldarium TaxID=215591 RepID=UPI0026EC48FE|nr:flagellar biosynthetic protein FliO [Gracilinema caldarium]
MAVSGRVLVYSQTTAQDKTAQPATANANGVPATAIPNDEGSLQIGEAAGTGGQQTQGTINFWTLFRLILVLGLSVAAIYGIVYGLKKIARPAEARDPYLRVLGTTHLGSNRFVHIVAVGTKAWLIGSSDGSVQPIAEITDKELLDAMFLDESKKMSESGKSGKDFASILRRFIPNQKIPETTIDLNAERLRKQRERLRGL